MTYLITPFFYILFYRFFFCFWFVVKEFYFYDRVDKLYLFVFGISLLMLLVFCTSNLVFLKAKLSKFKPVSKFNVCNKIQYLTLCLVWIIIVIYKFEDIPLFKLGGSDLIVETLSQNKILNLLTFGTLSGLGILFLFIGILERQSLIRLFFLSMSFLTAALFMKKSGILNHFLFYNLLLIIFFNFKVSFKQIILFICAVFFGIYTYFVTVNFTFSNLSELLDQILNLLYTSSTSSMNYLLIHGGINYAETYKSSLPEYLGWLAYLLNPILKLLTGEGIQSAIGPYVIAKIFENDQNLFGFNPTLLVEIWFVLGPIYSILLLIPIYIVLILLSLKVLLLIRKLAETKRNIAHFYYTFILLNFFMNVQFDVLNSIRSLLFSTIFYIFLLFFLKLKIRKTTLKESIS